MSQIRANTGAENNPGVNVETAAATPKPRTYPTVTFDEDGRSFYMFGGQDMSGI